MEKIRSFKFIGQIEVKNGLKISDPCYDVDTWCTLDVDSDKMQDGIYDCYVSKVKTTSGERIGKILIVSENAPHKELPKICLGYVGVDAGVCGFFDMEYFKEVKKDTKTDNAWYEENVINQIEKDFFICDGKGVYSTSGYGDGSYDVYARTSEKDNNLYDAFMIRFI